MCTCTLECDNVAIESISNIKLRDRLLKPSSPFHMPPLPLPQGQLVWTPDGGMVPLFTPTQYSSYNQYSTPSGYSQWVDPFHTPQYSSRTHSRTRHRHDSFM